MSWSVDPVAGLTAGSFIRATQGYNWDNRMICGSTDWPKVVSSKTLDVDDTYAADHLASISSYELVQIMTDGAQMGGGCGFGYPDCSHLSSIYASNPLYTGVTVQWDPFGVDTELRAVADGTLRPALLPIGGPQSNVTPDSNGYLMRPTALEWDGQDPANDANRTFWLPSEVIGVLGAVHFHHDMTGVANYSVNLGSGIRPWNVISGTPRLPGTAQPVICFV